MTEHPLGRREPTDMRHMERYPLRLTSTPLQLQAERVLVVTREWQRRYDQGTEGACVGFACSYAMSILNRRFYDAPWLYREAQLIDSWPETPPEEGTSVRAGMDVLRVQGHRRVWGTRTRPAEAIEGIHENRWATSVDQVRACLAVGAPVVLGIAWMPEFDTPVARDSGYRNGREWWIDSPFSRPARGGHAICAYGVSDRRQAVRLVNSWGLAWPRPWLPYRTLETLLARHGEATIITDR